MSAITRPVTVRYWASARAAAGVTEEVVAVPVDAVDPADTVRLQRVLDAVLERHADDTLPQVLRACSLLVGDRPVGGRRPDEVVVPDGDVVEVLPPFAGG